MLKCDHHSWRLNSSTERSETSMLQDKEGKVALNLKEHISELQIGQPKEESLKDRIKEEKCKRRKRG